MVTDITRTYQTQGREMESGRHPALARESYVLLAICLVDLLFTIWLVQTRRATEGNPLMSFYLDSGWLPLIGAKLILVASPIFIAEWARRFRPVFVRRALRFAIAVYLSLYAIAFLNAGISACTDGSLPMSIEQGTNAGTEGPVIP